MKLKLYVVRDELSIENRVLLTEQNDSLLKRNIEALLLSSEPNYINTNTKDKRVFYVGDLETDTGVVTPVDPIQPVITIEELRLEVLDKITAEKSKIMLKAISEGFDEKQAQAYLQLFETSNFYDLKTKKEEALEQEVKKLRYFIDQINAKGGKFDA